MRTRPVHRVLDFVLITLSVLSVCLIAWALVGGALSASIAGVRLSSRTVFRPTLIGLIALGISAALFEHRRQQYVAFLSRASHSAPAIAVILIIATVIIAIRYGAFEAAAADQYGYVSQANLWARHTLAVPQPLATVAPWPDADWTFSPLGYRPGVERGTIVPVYPAGLPLVMAGLITLLGAQGVYYAVPLLGALAVGATFLLGRHVSDETSGILSMALLLTSPAFLFHLREPMSDVPVAAWWLLSLALALRGSTRGAVGSGLAAAAAILTRPNLLPLAVPVALAFRFRHAAIFAVAFLPGCILVALLNTALYGWPTESGYGSLQTLFSFSHFAANLKRYPTWLIQTETPLICLAVLAPWVLQTPRQRSLASIFLAVAAVCFACYLFYLPFDNWTYLRFLLPAIPLLLVLSATVTLTWGRRRLPLSASLLLTAALLLLLAWRWDTSVSHGFRVSRAADRRFERVGAYVRDELPPNAIVFTLIHSGSIRHYSERTTIRWDVLDKDWLDRAVAFLRERGYPTYLVLDDDERAPFQQKFGGRSLLAGLSWAPVRTLSGTMGTTIYELAAPASGR